MAANLPALQLVQADMPSPPLSLPSGHETQPFWPTLAWYLPSTQSEHVDRPAVAANLPTPHDVQVAEAELEIEPEAQSLHSALLAAEYLPSAHPVQVEL